MVFTASDVSSLTGWEWGEYISEALVIIACAGELVADLGRKCLARAHRDRVERLSTILLVAALSASLICLVRTNELSGNVIGSLGTKAEDADKKAEKALTDSGTAQHEADEASTVAGDALVKSKVATIAAGKAQEKAGDVAKESDELNRQLLDTKTKLEAVDAKRTELEKSLVNLAVCNAPRVIPFSSGSNGTSVDPLKPFARGATIEFVPDAETRRAASNIAGTLDKAGWKITRFAPVDGIEDGVDVQPFVAPLPPSDMQQMGSWNSQLEAESRSRAAADAVVDFLHSYNWQARSGWPIDDKGSMIRDPKIISPDSLRIRVGLYPAVAYVSPPGEKDFVAAIAKTGREMEKHRKQAEAEELKREEEILKHLTAQQAAEFTAQREQQKKQEKLWMERYSGPCQPLTPLFPSLR
jgi:hypothetical protein